MLIRFGQSHWVGIGTLIRLGTNLVVLAAGYVWGRVPGIVVGSSAVALGVLAESLFIGLIVRPTIRGPLRAAPVGAPLTWSSFFAFYVPLALTSLLMLSAGPIISGTISRMPRALDSLAVWPVINGLGFTLRSLGIAFNEVVVTLLDRPRAVGALQRFARLLATSSSSVLLLVGITPLAGLYFGGFAGLSPELSALAAQGILVVFLMPGLGALQSWYQGVIVHSRRTRGVTESVLIYLLVNCAVLLLGLRLVQVTGLFLGLGAVVIGSLCQLVWLWIRSRPVLRNLGSDPIAPSSEPGVPRRA